MSVIGREEGIVHETPPVVPDLERAASLTVAAWSKDAAECRELLTMLDLPSGGAV